MATFSTIGIYGTTRESFFGALKKKGITHFCDIRLRRGLRGSLYTYGNAKELEAALEKLEIEYRHVQDLAPTKELIAKQFKADKAQRVSGRQREAISSEYATAYKKEVLGRFDVESFVESFPARAKVVLFCVEHEPAACHRSIVAQAIKNVSGKRVPDITP